MVTIRIPAHLTKLFLSSVSQITVETLDRCREKNQKTEKYKEENPIPKRNI